MQHQELKKEIEKVRRELNKRLLSSRKATKKSEENLKSAINKYHNAHSAAIKSQKILPMKKHQDLLAAITKAQEELTKSLCRLLEIEDEYRAYFQPI